MPNSDPMKSMNNNQRVFLEMITGALVYSVVFGFFVDYTDIIYTSSYSTTFFAAVLMQLLVYPTFLFKGMIVKHFKEGKDKTNKVSMVFCVWSVMFISKFVFLGALNFAFSDNIEISGFVGLVIIIICATVLTKLLEVSFKSLANK